MESKVVKQFIAYAAKAFASWAVPWIGLGLAAVAKWIGISLSVDHQKLETYVVTFIISAASGVWVYLQKNSQDKKNKFVASRGEKLIGG